MIFSHSVLYQKQGVTRKLFKTQTTKTVRKNLSAERFIKCVELYPLLSIFRR